MFIFLSKLLPLFVYPLSLTCLLLALGLLFYRRPRLQRLFLALALGLLLVSSNHWVARALARSLEWRYLPKKQLPEAQVIVVLGGATQAAVYPRPSVEVNGAGDRVIYAAHLYRQGKAPHLLLSGGSIDWLSPSREPDSAPAVNMATLLEGMGVPKEAIWLESTSRNTYENAVNSRRILEPLGIRRILLVTSAMHMPRAVGVFERQGFDVIPAPTDFSITQAGGQSSPSLAAWLLDWIPSVDDLRMTSESIKEYLGILVYGLRGWL
jgi:uncharacterized SAM-binding protein YcdF (DUF218 family)